MFIVSYISFLNFLSIFSFNKQAAICYILTWVNLKSFYLMYLFMYLCLIDFEVDLV